MPDHESDAGCVTATTGDAPGMKRILVIGSGGVGKSTFARRLAGGTGLPLFHLDALYWQPGWIKSSREDWLAKVDQLVAGERWIMDGNFGGTLERRLAACDTVIFLDLPPWVCLWRVLRRRIRHHGQARPDMTAGCHERLTWDFVWWILSYPVRRRPAILHRLATMHAGQRVHRLRDSRAMEDFLQSLPSAPPLSG